MAKGKINVAIIGGGKTGTPLLTQLLDADFVEVLGVADLDKNAPGMVLASEKGILVTSDYMELVRKGKEIDILIEVTGVVEVRKSIVAYLNETNNSHTVLMREIIAILMMSLAEGKLVDTFHGYQKYT